MPEDNPPASGLGEKLDATFGDEPAGSAGSTGGNSSSTGAAADLGDRIRHRTRGLVGQGLERVSQFAGAGKDNLATKLDEVAEIVTSFAKQAEENYGASVGGVGNRAAEGIAGIAEGLRGKSVEELVSDTRTLIRRNPEAAIVTAALVGFAAARIAKGGIDSPRITPAGSAGNATAGATA